MIWLALIVLVVLFVLSRQWEPPPNKPLERQPADHSKTFANRAAVHEAGHTVTAWCCTLVPEIGDVTIEAEDGGATRMWLYSQDSHESRWCDMVIYLAGMAAEIAAFGKVKTRGCGPDIERALSQAKKIAESGNVTPPWKSPSRKKSLEFDKMIHSLDPQHAKVLSEGYRMAYSILEAHGNRFYKVVSVLLTKKTASSTDIEAVLGPRAFVKIMGIPVAAGWFKPTFIVPIAQA
jgi:ATP-dependent Zn protease